MTEILAGDPVWNELPTGVDLISDGDQVVGFAFPVGSEDPHLQDEMNAFLAKIGMPPLPGEPPLPERSE